MLEANNLVKKFGSLVAINEISLKAVPGEIVGLLGPNGAGKTTTMRILTGYMPPTSGTVTVAGLDMLENATEAKQRIGYLPEIPPLYPELSVEDSLRFVAELFGVKDIGAHVERALEMTHLKEVGKRLVANISKGYRQRVGIAQAIVHNPPILILDEPTIGLDPKQIIEIRELLLRLKKDRVILLSSHILQEVAAVCDRVIIINRGQIIADDTMESLSRKLGKKKLSVTVNGDLQQVKEQIVKLAGVEEVVAGGSDLESIFLSLTG